ncbi:MAG: hypothetical protein L7U87_08410 [Chlamydiales bacterium]|nr:hypothetical protein [Chlamydiales bacterium]
MKGLEGPDNFLPIGMGDMSPAEKSCADTASLSSGSSTPISTRSSSPVLAQIKVVHPKDTQHNASRSLFGGTFSLSLPSFSGIGRIIKRWRCGVSTSYTHLKSFTKTAEKVLSTDKPENSSISRFIENGKLLIEQLDIMSDEELVELLEDIKEKSGSLTGKHPFIQNLINLLNKRIKLATTAMPKKEKAKMLASFNKKIEALKHECKNSITILEKKQSTMVAVVKDLESFRKEHLKNPNEDSVKDELRKQAGNVALLLKLLEDKPLVVTEEEDVKKLQKMLKNFSSELGKEFFGNGNSVNAGDVLLALRKEAKSSIFPKVAPFRAAQKATLSILSQASGNSSNLSKEQFKELQESLKGVKEAGLQFPTTLDGKCKVQKAFDLIIDFSDSDIFSKESLSQDEKATLFKFNEAFSEVKALLETITPLAEIIESFETKLDLAIDSLEAGRFEILIDYHDALFAIHKQMNVGNLNVSHNSLSYSFLSREAINLVADIADAEHFLLDTELSLQLESSFAIASSLNQHSDSYSYTHVPLHTAAKKERWLSTESYKDHYSTLASTEGVTETDKANYKACDQLVNKWLPHFSDYQQAINKTLQRTSLENIIVNGLSLDELACDAKYEKYTTILRKDNSLSEEQLASLDETDQAKELNKIRATKDHEFLLKLALIAEILKDQAEEAKVNLEDKEGHIMKELLPLFAMEVTPFNHRQQVTLAHVNQKAFIAPPAAGVKYELSIGKKQIDLELQNPYTLRSMLGDENIDQTTIFSKHHMSRSFEESGQLKAYSYYTADHSSAANFIEGQVS